MTNFNITQAVALALSAVVTLATLGGLSVLAETEVANEVAKAQPQAAMARAAVQDGVQYSVETIVFHRACA